MRRRIAIVLCVFLVATCEEARAEWVLELYTGSSWTRDSNLRVTQSASDSDATFGDVHWEARPFEDSPYYGLRVAYYPSAAARLGATFDFTHYKMYAVTDRTTSVSGRWNGVPLNERAPLASRVQALEISHGVNLAALNAEYRWTDADSVGGFARGWSTHAGAGIVGYWPHAEGLINDVPVGADYRYAGSGVQIFGGGEYRLNRRFGLLIEGKAEAGKLDIDLVPQTRIVTHTRTLHALAGVTLHLQ
ncbi:MAG TPA: hypothetical protein VG994_07105 [Steroidobacteraceae bacterium]|nr:hypothetical protein [Steroidobacteraceae bacterium]